MSDSKDSRKATRGESSSYGTSAAGAPRRVAGGGRTWLGRFVGNRVAPIGLVIIAASLGVALCAPVLVPHDIRTMHPAEALRPPGGPYLFGTDEFGRDVLSRVLMGSRISLAVAFLSVLTSVLVGTTLGLTAGFYGGWGGGGGQWGEGHIFRFSPNPPADGTLAGTWPPPAHPALRLL